ncbi:FERM domain-containing protein 1 isoform X1 [Rana temporaria]|uniref:FERM domain-containing protein 1 isoform X1 n=1 Tax=Rana temporaria TaxID=8407 RepID=UPI001AAC7E5D|nr:FERM domain-containing protein 1 isoform X1 [Rana temporaria]XP_040206609.1 FERM domain-containing protein 1 isoform X1 [Rana temporaria]
MSRPFFQASMPEQDYRNVCVWLPNREQLDVTVGTKATGQELFNKVCEALDIKQAHLFGLSIVKNNEYIFMDLEQKLNKYFPKEWKRDPLKTTEKFSPPCVAFFRVQFYVETGKIISDKIARKLYYYHLKEQVLRSHCTHTEETYFLLAAYALQADCGNQRNPIKNYFEPEAYFPHWIIAKRGSDYILKHAPEVHKELQGMSVKEAVLNFIRESCVLEDVPVHYYRLLKDKKEDRPSIILGVTLRGIHIYQEIDHIRQLLYDFPWSNVGKLTFLGKKFEIQPDGLPSARKLVYYTGCPFRSQHLLHLLSNSHRLYLNIQPVIKEIKKVEEAEEKKCYRESYVSDNMEMDLDPSDKCSHGSSRESAKNNRLSRQSTVSHSSSHTSGIEADSHHRMSEEMSVDDPFGLEVVNLNKSSYSSTISQSTSGIEHESKGRTDGDSQGDEVELSVDKPLDAEVTVPISSDTSVLETEEQCVDSPIMDNYSWQTVKLRGQRVDPFHKANTSKSRNSADRYSQSLDDVRIYQETHPPFSTSVLTSDTSQSYTFGCAIEEIDYSCTYTTSDCKVKSTLLGKRSMNCLSLDLLGENQLLEFIL